MNVSVAGLLLHNATEVAFFWGPPTQDTGRCWYKDVYWSFQAVGIRRADGILVMTVAPSRVCVLMAGLSWGAMIAHAPQVCSPTQPESNQSDSGQVRPVNQPSTNTHSTNTLHSI